jgi:hypothetical protein
LAEAAGTEVAAREDSPEDADPEQAARRSRAAVRRDTV